MYKIEKIKDIIIYILSNDLLPDNFLSNLP